MFESALNSLKGAFNSTTHWLKSLFDGNSPSFQERIGHIFILVSKGILILIVLALISILAIIAFYLLWYAACKIREKLSQSSGSGFHHDIELGLSSENFNLEENVNKNDSRSGLDLGAKFWILLYMAYYKENFDDARARYVRSEFSKNNIAPDGQPLDPRAFQF